MVIYGDHVAYIFLYSMAISISTYSIQFILDIELIRIECFGRACQLNVLKLILKEYCMYIFILQNLLDTFLKF